MTSVSWISDVPSGRLGLMPRPRGGDWLEDEVRALADSGVEVLVSFLGPFEIAELDLSLEGHYCSLNGIEFLSFPITDRSTPDSMQKAVALIRTLAAHVREGQTVVLHCRLGIGRAGMFSAATLVALGEATPNAVHRVAKARGMPIPDTPQQLTWLAAMEGELKAR